MSENISVGNSIVITLFSITMVFIILIIIAVFISLLKNLDKNKEESPAKSTNTLDSKTDKIKEKQIETIGQIENKVDDEELIAVISAAVAASLGVSIPQINIKKINRINNSSPVWSTAGIQEQIYSKL